MLLLCRSRSPKSTSTLQLGLASLDALTRLTLGRPIPASDAVCASTTRLTSIRASCNHPQTDRGGARWGRACSNGAAPSPAPPPRRHQPGSTASAGGLQRDAGHEGRRLEFDCIRAPGTYDASNVLARRHIFDQCVECFGFKQEDVAAGIIYNDTCRALLPGFKIVKVSK